MHFHCPNGAKKGDDYFLMWTKVEHRTARQWMLVRLQPNIAARGPNKARRTSFASLIVMSGRLQA
jgi:hypothetical protein